MNGEDEYLDGELNTENNIALLHVVNGARLEVGEASGFLKESLEALQETGLSIDFSLSSII